MTTDAADTPASRAPREYRAAGGVVVDATGRVLTIRRWVMRNGNPEFEVRLPKGHVEPGETDAEAALREVCEEAGLCSLSLVADLGEVETRFVHQDRDVLRHEHYYLMRPGAAEPVTGHPMDPESEEARFVPHWYAGLDAAEAALTFESEREFVRRARQAARGPASPQAGAP
jgi:8-oxo-dGTP pyrophosphatase MutT (NUDIX family)